ncbi:MAG: hypothetical protein ACO32I_01260 [Candidatus Limnocylindrus sp.]
MTASAVRKLKLRLFIEGVECPVMGADIRATLGEPAQASIHVIPHPSVLRLKPRSLVMLFYYDWLSGKSESDDSGYRLLFSGDLMGVDYAKTNSSRSATLACEDHTSYYDIGYASYGFAEGTDTTQNLLGQQSRFVGAQNAAIQVTNTPDLKGFIAALFRRQEAPRTAGYHGLKNLLGTVIRVVEVFTGLGSASSSNQFFKFNSLRLGLLGQIAAYEKDDTAGKLFGADYAVDFITERVEQLGELITLRQVINLVLELIYYVTAPNTCAQYKAAGKVKAIDTRALSASAATMAADITTRKQSMLAGTQTNTTGVQFTGNASAISLGNAVLDTTTTPYTNFVTEARKISSASPSLYSQCEIAFAAAIRLFEGQAVNEDSVRVALAELDIVITADVTVADAQKLYTTLLVPDLFFAVAPSCNVLYPDMYGQVTYGARIAKEPTRMHLTTNLDASLTPTARGVTDLIYYAPSVEQLRDAQRLSVAAIEGKGSTTIPFARLFEHELFTGIIPTFSRVDRLAFMIAKQSELGSDEELIDDFFVRVANYQYTRQKLGRRNLSASGTFNPSAAVGFPMVVIDGTATPAGRRYAAPSDAQEQDENEHYIGLLTSVSHNISQDGAASTSYQLQYVRPHRSRDDEFLNRLVTSEAVTAQGAVLPVEEAIRPRFIADGYSSMTIGKEVYQQLLGCNSVIDKTLSANPERVNIVSSGTGTSPSSVSGITQEMAIDRLAYTYAGAGVDRAGWSERQVRRPIATLPEALEFYALAYARSAAEAAAKKINTSGVVYVEGSAPCPPGYTAITAKDVLQLNMHIHPQIDTRLARHAAVVEYTQYISNRALRG